jgi:hypothetical protein
MIDTSTPLIFRETLVKWRGQGECKRNIRHKPCSGSVAAKARTIRTTRAAARGWTRSGFAIERDAIKFHPVIDQTEAQFFSNLFLKGFKLGIDEFDYLASLYINQMIMMGFGRSFITRAAIAKIMAV